MSRSTPNIVSLFVSEATSARCDTSVSVAVALSHPERARNGGLLRLSVRIARGPSRFWVISGREPQVSATQSKRGQMQCHNSSGVTGFPTRPRQRQKPHHVTGPLSSASGSTPFSEHRFEVD